MKGNNMQPIELGNAAKITLNLLGDALEVFAQMTGHEAIVHPQNEGGNCTLVTSSQPFADFFQDVVSGEQAV